MIRIKNHKQRDIFDPWEYLSPKRRRMLDQSWPGLFRQELLHELPVDQIKPFFNQDVGRPGKELYTLLGTLLFQQTMDLSDYETAQQLSFNIQWHYALNITEESDEAKYISEKTIWSWRQTLLEHNLDQLMLENITAKLAKIFSVDIAEQRLDSLHIKSNMRRLGRIGIFTQTIHKFLVNLKRGHRELYESVPSELSERYLSKQSLAAFSLVKPSESAKTLEQVSADLYMLVKTFEGEKAVRGMHSYKLMQRVLDEQCNVVDDGHGTQISVKAAKQIDSDSLQNPSDPDATYSGHKGQGYQVQVMETFCRSENQEEKDQRLDLITHVAVEQACEHDSNALVPAIEQTEQHDLKPQTIIADTLYGSDDNHTAAASHEVDLIAPTYRSYTKQKKASVELSHFSFSDSGYVANCPVGHRPVKVNYKKKTGRFSARFELDHCSCCPHGDHCPVIKGKRYNFLRYSDKDCRLAVRRAIERSDDFIDTYRWRAGVEATMSQFDRLTGVKHLRVRGYEAVRYCVTLKAAGLNMLRAARVRKAQMKADRPAGPGNSWKSPLSMVYLVVKERIGTEYARWYRFIRAQVSWVRCYTFSAL